MTVCLPDEVDVGETLGVVRGPAPVSAWLALEPGQAGVAGAAQVRDEGAGDGGLGVWRCGRPAQDRIIVPAAPVCRQEYHYCQLHHLSQPVGISIKFTSSTEDKFVNCLFIDRIIHIDYSLQVFIFQQTKIRQVSPSHSKYDGWLQWSEP